MTRANPLLPSLIQTRQGSTIQQNRIRQISMHLVLITENTLLYTRPRRPSSKTKKSSCEERRSLEAATCHHLDPSTPANTILCKHV